MMTEIIGCVLHVLLYFHSVLVMMTINALVNNISDKNMFSSRKHNEMLFDHIAEYLMSMTLILITMHKILRICVNRITMI